MNDNNGSFFKFLFISSFSPIKLYTSVQVNVTIAGLGADKVYKCSRGVLVNCDTDLDDAVSKGPYDVVLLPGGPGHKTFSTVSMSP